MIENRETIQQRILENIEDKYDKTEGSFLHDIIKPIAIELENTWKDIETFQQKLSIEKLSGEELEQRVYEKTGISRKKATKSSGYVLITGDIGSVISEGELVSSDTINFIAQETKTIEGIDPVVVLVECEKEGVVGNVPVGAIQYFPITISGVKTVTNDKIFSNGYEEESDQELLERYYDNVKTPSTSGNVYHYRNWAKEEDGVGEATVFPTWDVNGSVKVIVIDSNSRAINDPDMMAKIVDRIEKNRPIGANVTVESGEEVSIRVSASVKLIQGYSIGQVQSEFVTALEEYFKDIAFVENYVSYARIGNVLLGITGVKDISNVRINDLLTNISLADNQIPVLESVNLGLEV